MGIRIENNCVGCLPEMGCLGNSCPNINVKQYFCDQCEESFSPNELYQVEDKQLCEECLLDKFPKVG